MNLREIVLCLVQPLTVRLLTDRRQHSSSRLTSILTSGSLPILDGLVQHPSASVQWICPPLVILHIVLTSLISGSSTCRFAIHVTAPTGFHILRWSGDSSQPIMNWPGRLGRFPIPSGLVACDYFSVTSARPPLILHPVWLCSSYSVHLQCTISYRVREIHRGITQQCGSDH